MMRKTKGICALALATGLAIAPLWAQLPGIPVVIPGIGSGVPVVDVGAILQAIKTLQQAIQMYQQMVFNAKQLANLRTFHSPWALWYSVSATSRYGYNAGWVAAANGQTAGLPGYNASVLPMPIYGSLGDLAPATQQRFQYRYDTAGLADSVAQTSLSTTGSIRQNAGQTEAALVNLRDSVLDPNASEVQVLQKISAGAYIQARTQNDTNKLLAAQAEAAAFQAKLERDRIQEAAADYQESLLRAAERRSWTADASKAIRNFRWE